MRTSRNSVWQRLLHRECLNNMMRISRYKLAEVGNKQMRVEQSIARCKELLKTKGISLPDN